ncbi:MAG: magnesium chelatase ATPase subunit D [Anaerolineae bacterium]|nr:magnesium chelatase ATPase subunit D [Anaerolineae bacterium]
MTAPRRAGGSAGTHLPFPALVGLETVQQALILLTIDPRLRGVILAAPAGTGKSSLARGLRDLSGRDVPFVELPASIDIENLLGGPDLEATLRTGRLVLQRGVLARAHGGIVYADGINLMTDATTNLLLSVLDEGQVNLQRDGISLVQPARFSLVGSYDPAEGLPRKHLLDRLGLIVALPGQRSPDQRRRVLEHNLRRPPHTWRDDLAFLRGVILAARDFLPRVTLRADQLRTLSTIALHYGVEGHRADLFAGLAACASAAYDLREDVTQEDLELAVRLVMLPRATQLPASPPDDLPAPPPPPPSPDLPDQPEAAPEDAPDEDTPPPETAGLPEDLLPPPEQILEALATELPPSLEALPFQHLRRGAAGSRGTTAARRGRHVGSTPGKASQGRLDIIATLRTAAPWQPIRRARPAPPTTSADRDRRRIHITPADVRLKRYRSKAGALFCFAVDASGSMALHRMRQAKGAVHTLLGQAYVKRDRVALIAFRGEQADLLMPPTHSVELARRALDVLPTGGATPLAAALLLATEVARQARQRGILQTILVLLTDGRANQPFQPGSDPDTELQQIGRYVALSGLRVIVVDTKRSYLSQGEARRLAGWLHGEYAYLPNASGQQIGRWVAEQR